MKKLIASVLAVSLIVTPFSAQAKTSTFTKILIGTGIAAAGYMIGRAKTAEYPQQPTQVPQPVQAPAGQPQQLPPAPIGYGYVQTQDPACKCLVWTLKKLP